jgi:hypothetical protein
VPFEAAAFEPAAFGRVSVEPMPFGRVPDESMGVKSPVHHGS